jgi:hypothetical protein
MKSTQNECLVFIREENEMGSYLVLDGRENNSKAISGMMVSVIREIDRKDKKYYEPDYYNENGIGCGDWIIKKRGLAAICSYMRNILDDEEWIEKYTYENHEWHKFNGDKEKYYTHWLKETEEDLKIVYDIFVNVLIDVVLFDNKRIFAHWV